MLNSTYNTNGNVIISAIHKIKSISDKEAWDEFVENNVNFFTILEEIVPGVLGTDDSTYGLPISLVSKIKDVQLSLKGFKVFTKAVSAIRRQIHIISKTSPSW